MSSTGGEVKAPGRGLSFLLVVLWAFVLAVAGVVTRTAASPGQAVRLRGHIPPAVAHARAVGRVAAGDRVDLAIGLSLRNQPALQELLQRLYDPKDPLYGQYLTTEQFTNQFGATPEAYQAVAAFAQANGLTVTQTHENRLLLDVSGPAAAVESAFGVQLLQFQGADGEIFRAPDADPAVPAVLSRVVTGVAGLDNRLRAHSHVAYPGARPRAAAVAHQGTGPNGGMAPADIKKAYNLSTSPLTGAGQTLALFELDGYTTSDITTYESQFGLPNVTLQNILIDGFNGSAGAGAIEVTLDIEVMLAIAPGVSKILVYEGPNGGKGILDTYSKIASDNAASQMSSSWGLAEPSIGAAFAGLEAPLFQQMAAEGMTFYVASGDNGAYDDGSNITVDDPASQPYATGVGGTTLFTNGAGGTWKSETTWNSSPLPDPGGGGGGISVLWSIPAYQAGVVSSASKGSTTARNVPDVSLDADPGTGYAIYVGGGWALVGGTSAAAPLWAGFTALVNQNRLGAGSPALGFANPTLYNIGKGPNGAVDFHDIADNSTNLFYPAVTGYDCATGWGTINGLPLLTDLIGVPANLSISGTILFNSTGLAGVTVTAGTGSAVTAANGTYTIKNLTAGNYTVTPALTGFTFSPPSRSVTLGPNATGIDFSAAPAFAPPAPTNLQATPLSTSRVQLNWTDNSTIETGYEVERQLGAGPFVMVASLAPDTTTWVDTGLNSNTTYTYRVRAVDAAGPSTYAGPASALTYPATPANLAVNVPAPPPGRSQLVLTWQDQSSLPSAFRVERSTDLGATYQEISITPVGTNTYTDTGLDTSTTYYYRVRATNTTGNSPYANVAFNTTLLGPPNAPSALTATVVSSQEIDLAWVDNSKNESGFRLERVVGTSFAAGTGLTALNFGANVTTAQDTGLNPNTAYTYRVFAVNSGGDSPASREAGGTTLRTPPAPPQMVGVTVVSSSALTVAWTANPTNLTGLKIERSTNGTTFTLAGTAAPSDTSFTDTGLKSNTQYTYRVKGTNLGSDSLPSATAAATTKPAVPANLTVAVVSNTSLSLTWTDASDLPSTFSVERTDGSAGFAEVATPSSPSFVDTGLTPATTYTYRVRATNGTGATGYSDYSATATAATLPNVPTAPSGLTVSVISASELDLSWTDNSANESGFKIERSPDGTTFRQIATTAPNATSFADQGLLPATTYYYRVRAYNAGGDSAYTLTQSATTLPNPPSAPFGLSATVLSTTSVRLDWQDSSNNEESFRIERQDAGGSFLEIDSVGVNVQTYTDSGVAAGQTYTYRVRARNAGGSSGYSNTAQASTPPNAPTAPGNLTLTALSSSAVQVGFQDNSNNETGFTVYRALGGGSFAPIGSLGSMPGSPNALTYTDSGLQPSTTYSYRVEAFNAGGAVSTAPASITTKPQTPTPPAGLVAKALDANEVQLTWTDKSNNETGFLVEYSADATTFVQLPATGANATSQVVSGLHSNSGYTFRVRATNDGGTSAPSPAASALTLPSAPTGLIASGQTKVTLTWTDTSDQPSGFRIERQDGSAAFVQIDAVLAGSKGYQDTSTVAGHTYTYRVRATNATGNSDYSNNAVASLLPSAPAAPTGVTVTALSSGALQISWAAGTGNETGFHLDRSLDGQAWTPLPDVIGQTSTTDSGLSAITTYHYRVSGYNAGGVSPFAFGQGATLPNAPSAPSALTVTPLSSSSLRLAWTDNSNNETGFKIERSSDGANFSLRATVAANTASYADTGLTPGSTWYYRVRSTNAGGDSSPSDAVSGSTFPAPPAAPSGLTASVASPVAVLLSWTDQSSTERYFAIDRKQGSGSFTTIGQAAANATTFTDTTVTPGTTYTYQVRAVNDGGSSSPSNSAQATLPFGIASVTLTPSEVKGGKSVSAKITFSGAAPAGTSVTASTNSASAKAPGKVKVAAGKSTVTFQITTKKVTASTTVEVSVSFGSQVVKVNLVVDP